MIRKLTATLVWLGMAVVAFGQTGYTQEGNASYYADKFQGRTTASGERYDAAKHTCAHLTLPYGTVLRVTNLANKKTSVVRVNDRGPFAPNRILDVSRAAADELGITGKGVVKVRIETLPQGEFKESGGSTPTTVATLPAPQQPKPTPAKPAESKPAQPSTGGAKEGLEQILSRTLQPGVTLATAEGYTVMVGAGTRGQFGVQLASYSDVANLGRQVTELDADVRSKLVVLLANANGALVYKIVEGPYATRKEAEAKKESLSGRFGGCFIVAL